MPCNRTNVSGTSTVFSFEEYMDPVVDMPRMPQGGSSISLQVDADVYLSD